MARLWDKGEKLNEKVHEFTVGDDPSVDRVLVEADLVASAAHAKMLLHKRLLSEADCGSLLGELQKLSEVNRDGKFVIPTELEDCHTAIESSLVEKIGEAGRRIHTGRSRNDQVMVAMRLYLREELLSLLALASSASELFFARAEKDGDAPMPGYTHFQPAMPTSVGIWLQAFGEMLLELIREGLSLLELLNSNPLGVASGFSTSLSLDREATTAAMGFSRVQRNSIAVQNSRGQYELKALRFATDLAGVIEKFACDMILYTTREFGFFSLPNEFTTGSSIMPQKHNPDVIELLRARAAKVRGAENELSWVMAKLPSNYHRDFQYTKEPVVRGLSHVKKSLEILSEVVKAFSINKSALEKAMSVDLYATYDVYREVKAGKAFREAYRLTAERVKSNALKKEELEKDFLPVAKEAKEELTAGLAELHRLRASIASWQEKLAQLKKTAFKL